MFVNGGAAMEHEHRKAGTSAPARPPFNSTLNDSCDAYCVRSVGTKRACRPTVILLPAMRRQEASKFGQAFSEQSRPIDLTSRRSPLARACGTDASTCGAKPGKTVNAAAANAATAIAERALIMTVPMCPKSLRLSFCWGD